MSRVAAACFFILMSSAVRAQAFPGDPPAWDQGFEFAVNAPVWRGFSLFGGIFSGSGIDMDAPVAINARSNIVDPPLQVKFRYEEQDFDSSGLGVTMDFDLVRLSAFFFSGEFDAEGVLSVNDGVSPTSSSPVEVNGDFQGFKIGLTWLAIRYRGSGVEAALGPDLAVGWMQHEIDSVPGSPLPLEDTVDELSGSFGPRISFRVFIGSMGISLEAAVPYLFGRSEGFAQEGTVGIGFRF
jgi:hypothetical protein